MMDFKNTVQTTVQQGFIKRIADDILQGIDKVRNNPKMSSRRWLWEMMQNARDVPNNWGGVGIKIILDQNSLKFCHNGNPFSLLNLTNLILQVSSKDEEADDKFVGKFGTGFLVTHLLSKNLNLKGILQTPDNSHYKFCIEIDRSADNSKDLQSAINAVIQELERVDDSIKFIKEKNYKNSEEEFHTLFDYPLDETSLNFAKDGVNDLLNTLPLTLLFTDKIKNVQIDNRIENQTYQFSKKLHSEHQQRQIWEVNSNGHQDFFYLKIENDITLALKIKSNTDFSPVEFSKNTPRLYRDFPLIGSENFGFPFVIHSSSFYPDEQRSGLLLEDEKNQKVAENKKLLIAATNTARRIVGHYSNYGPFQTNFLLATINNPFTGKNEINEWYENNIVNVYQNSVYEGLQFVNRKAGKSLFKEVLIPYVRSSNQEINNAFYDVCAGFISDDNLPQKPFIRNWQNAVENSCDEWENKNLLEYSDLIGRISIKNHCNDVSNLNKLYHFLYVNGYASEIQSRKMIPNYFGNLTTLNQLNVNDNIQEELLDIITLQIPRYKDRLILKNIDVKVQHDKVSSASLFREINTTIKDFHQVRLDNDELNFIYELLRLQYADTENFRKIILRNFCELFGFQDEIKIIKNEENSFDFSPSTKKAIEFILHKVQSLNHLTSLSKILGLNEQETNTWLVGLLSQIGGSHTYRDLLQDYRVFPNYYGDFAVKAAIANISDSDDDAVIQLIEMHSILLPTSDLKSKLLHVDYKFDVGQRISFNEIALNVDDKIKSIYLDWNDSSTEQKKTVLEILEWFSTAVKNYDSYFPWLSSNKASVLFQQFENNEVKEAMFSILKSDQDKIVALSLLVANKSIDEINSMADIIQGITSEELENLKQLKDDINEIGESNIKEFIAKRKEEKRDFIFKKAIGNDFENVFLKHFNSLNLPFDIKKIEAPADYRISNGDKVFYVELKSYSNNVGDNKIRMSFKQGKGATDFKENYALCILKRPDNWKVDSQNNYGYQYMLDNTKVVLDVGKRMELGVSKSIEFQKSLINSDIHGVGIEFKDNDFKFVLLPTVWNGEDNLENLFARIVSKLSN